MGAVACAFLAGPLAAQQSSTKAPTLGTAAKSFDTPQQAAGALIDAAEKFDERALAEIFGSHGEDVYFTGEYPQDRERALDFAAQAREKKACPWIRRPAIGHSFLWATRTGRSLYRL